MLCFWGGIFPTAVAFTQKLGDGFEKSTIIALTVLFTGLGQLSGKQRLKMGLGYRSSSSYF
jgi:hypothetical protein